MILQHNPQVDVQNNLGERPILLAAERKLYDIMWNLVRRGADLATKGRSNVTVLHYLFNSQYITNANERKIASEQGILTLKSLYQRLKPDKIRLFFQTKLTSTETTPLHYAAASNLVEVVRLLLETYKIDSSPQTRSGNTPLHYAATLGNKEIVICLLKNNAYTSIKNNHKPTPLDCARKADHYDVWRLIAYFDMSVSRSLRMESSLYETLGHWTCPICLEDNIPDESAPEKKPLYWKDIIIYECGDILHKNCRECIAKQLSPHNRETCPRPGCNEGETLTWYLDCGKIIPINQNVQKKEVIEL